MYCPPVTLVSATWLPAGWRNGEKTRNQLCVLPLSTNPWTEIEKELEIRSVELIGCRTRKKCIKSCISLKLRFSKICKNDL